ncbi:DUF6879 family protein [Streptomyces sp. NPDC005533]|uniref:DUF6879 family protein n=1 Tax=Streptomyces sp. NPDC005533 TaxID=3364723 RepID=UPI0036A0467C
MVSAAPTRGVVMRRARIVSEPVSDYIGCARRRSSRCGSAGSRTTSTPGTLDLSGWRSRTLLRPHRAVEL